MPEQVTSAPSKSPNRFDRMERAGAFGVLFSLGVSMLVSGLYYRTPFRGLQSQLQAADARMIQEDQQPCCYARSDKYWVTDPTGIAWETFHTLGAIPLYGEDTAVFDHGASNVPVPAPNSQCCVPTPKIEIKNEVSFCCAK